MMTLRKEPVSAVSDVQLLERCRRGDTSAYGQIVERYQTLVCSVAYNQCGDFGLSEDLAQEAFLAAWEKLADLRDTNRFKPWICAIVRNLTSRVAKRNNRSVPGNAAQLEAATDRSTDAAAPDEQAISTEEGQLVWQALADIPEAYREPMILFYREEQSVARVAAALELSQDAVKQRLSRGRGMLQQELAARIEKTLTKSKPSTAFTAAVLAGLTGMMTNTAVASTATATFAKSAGAGLAKSGLGGMLGMPLLTILAQLPLIGWLFKMSFEETRSGGERQLTKRVYVLLGCLFVVYAVASFSSIWWQKFLPDVSWLRASLIPGLMALNFIPMFWVIFRYSNQMKRLRVEEGTATPPRPLFATTDQRLLLSKTHRFFVLSGFLVIAWPAALAIRAADGLVLVGVLAASVAISLVASRISRRFPKYEFQSYAASNPINMLLGIAIIKWRSDVWIPDHSDFGWFVVALTGMSTTAIVLNVLVWKKIHGRPDGTAAS
jgi:RNA polymerase sigma factor (sigma-70 family)